jgi:acyl dehydratase
MNNATTLNAASEGKELVSDWLLIDQAMVSSFGELTLDPDPMHMDPVWAKANGTYGGTIAYGFLTISLLSYLIHTVRDEQPNAKDEGHYLNYGFDKIRLISPIPTGSRIRGHFISSTPKVDRKGLHSWPSGFPCGCQNPPKLGLLWIRRGIARPERSSAVCNVANIRIGNVASA